MSGGRGRTFMAIAALVGLALCSWCSLAGVAGGWLAGREFGLREAQARYPTPDTRLSLVELGVLVQRVERNGPASRAGLERGMLIVALDGMHIQDSRDLRALLLKHRPDEVVQLTVLDDHGQHTLAVRLGVFPGSSQRAYLGIYFTARDDDGPADL